MFGAVAIVMVFNVVAALVTNVDEVGIGTAALISLACLLIPIPVAWSLAPKLAHVEGRPTRRAMIWSVVAVVVLGDLLLPSLYSSSIAHLIALQVVNGVVISSLVVLAPRIKAMRTGEGDLE